MRTGEEAVAMARAFQELGIKKTLLNKSSKPGIINMDEKKSL